MKKLIICALSLLTVFTLVACTKEEKEEIANPWMDYDSLEEAIKESSINLVVPTENVEAYRCMGNEIIEVIYSDDTTIRKGTVDNISGDYNTYNEVQEVTIGDYTVALSGNDSKIYLATFTYGGYNYSVSCNGKTVEEITSLIEQVR